MARRNETVFKETGAARVSKSAASALFGDSAGVPRIFVLAATARNPPHPRGVPRRSPEEYRADPPSALALEHRQADCCHRRSHHPDIGACGHLGCSRSNSRCQIEILARRLQRPCQYLITKRADDGAGRLCGLVPARDMIDRPSFALAQWLEHGVGGDLNCLVL